MIPDARELHRVITASVRELLETARLEAQAGPMDVAEIERLIFRAAAPIVHSVTSLTEAQRGELLPNIVRVMLAASWRRPDVQSRSRPMIAAIYARTGRG